jgi:hypothetical protein
MAIDRTGTWWRGSGPEDLDEYLAVFSADGHRVETVRRSRCSSCGGTEFRLLIDDEEGCAERTCAACGTSTMMLDSAEHADDAELDTATCPCGGEVFDAAVGFAHYADTGDVRWVYVGLRCVEDGVLGVYADWKIDYAPTSHLYDAV